MSKDKKVPEDIITSFIDEIQTVKKNQRSMVVITQGVFEMFMNMLAEQCCKNGKLVAGYHCSYQLIMLNELGIVDDNQYRLLRAFNDIRNDAGHGYEFILTKKMLEPFKSMKSPDEQQFDDPALFHILCFKLVFNFWNDKMDTLLSHIIKIKR
jgi:hypothetical protein